MSQCNPGFRRSDSEPGGLGAYDAEYVRRFAPVWNALFARWFRARVEGMANLPNGPFLAVGNHSGGVMVPDTLVWMAAYHTRNLGPPMLALAHDAMFRHYPRRLTHSLARMGAVRADMELARAALHGGHAVTVYPGGDHDACRSYRDRNRIVFAGRTGYARLAIEEGVPIVPVASVGGHEAMFVLWDGAALAERIPWCRRHRMATLPLTLSVPWGLWFGPQPGYLPLPTQITTRVLQPLTPTPADGARPSATSVSDLDQLVRDRLQNALDEMSAERSWPVLG